MDSLQEWAKKRKNWPVRKLESHEAMRPQQIADWQALSPMVRMGASTRLLGRY